MSSSVKDMPFLNLDEYPTDHIIQLALYHLNGELVSDRSSNYHRTLVGSFTTAEEAFLFAAVCRGLHCEIGNVCYGGPERYLLAAFLEKTRV